MRPVGLLSTCLTALLLISPATARSEGETSGCELLPDERIACSGEFLRQLAEGYQHARANARVCEVRLNECRSVPPPVAVEPPISPLGALVVGGAAGIALAAGAAVLVAGGPVEVGASLAAAGGAGLTAGVVVLTW